MMRGVFGLMFVVGILGGTAFADPDPMPAEQPAAPKQAADPKFEVVKKDQPPVEAAAAKPDKAKHKSKHKARKHKKAHRKAAKKAASK